MKSTTLCPECALNTFAIDELLNMQNYLRNILRGNIRITLHLLGGSQRKVPQAIPIFRKNSAGQTNQNKGVAGMKVNRNKKVIIAVTIAVSFLIFLGYLVIRFATKSRQSSGEIFLYGEKHSVNDILEKEFELWSSYYQNEGMRNLFVELTYYTTEYMNLWMKSDDDDILYSLYQDWAGTAICSQDVINFYKRIKNECPETVFHGTDVGHQHDTTGKRFLEHLESTGQRQSEVYRLSQENIRQGQYYYQHSDNAYRENTMVENFIREFDSLNGANVMGIYGSAHTNTEAMGYAANSVPCMANQLYKKYGNALHTEDLTPLALNNEASRTDTIKIGEKEYTALYFGKVDLSSVFPDYQCREFWRLENAYDDFKDNSKTGNVLPYNNYPMEIETGQTFVIDYTKADGSIVREYHRSDGNTWQGSPVTEEFRID